MKNTTLYFPFGCMILFALSASVFAQDPLAGRKQTSDSKNGTNPSTQMVWQPNPAMGVFELKETDKTGKVTQWYQHFVDNEGKEVMEIIRQVASDAKLPYESIHYIFSFVYNKDRDLSEKWEFSGDGNLLHHVIYRYDAAGKWLEGDVYDATGKLTGKELTPPESFMYGQKK